VAAVEAVVLQDVQHARHLGEDEDAAGVGLGLGLGVVRVLKGGDLKGGVGGLEIEGFGVRGDVTW